jgi:hypothetical protein
MWQFFLYNQIFQSQRDKLILSTGEGCRGRKVISVRLLPSLWLFCNCHSLAVFVVMRFRSGFHSSFPTRLPKKTKNEELLD